MVSPGQAAEVRQVRLFRRGRHHDGGGGRRSQGGGARRAAAGGIRTRLISDCECRSAGRARMSATASLPVHHSAATPVVHSLDWAADRGLSWPVSGGRVPNWRATLGVASANPHSSHRDRGGHFGGGHRMGIAARRRRLAARPDRVASDLLPPAAAPCFAASVLAAARPGVIFRAARSVSSSQPSLTDS